MCYYHNLKLHTSYSLFCFSFVFITHNNNNKTSVFYYDATSSCGYRLTTCRQLVIDILINSSHSWDWRWSQLKTNKTRNIMLYIATHFRPIVRIFRDKTNNKPRLKRSLSLSLYSSLSTSCSCVCRWVCLAVCNTYTRMFMCMCVSICVLGFFPEPASVGFVLWGHHDGLVLVDLLAAAAAVDVACTHCCCCCYLDSRIVAARRCRRRRRRCRFELWGLSFWVECTPERCLNAASSAHLPPLKRRSLLAHFAESCLDTTYTLKGVVRRGKVGHHK